MTLVGVVQIWVIRKINTTLNNVYKIHFSKLKRVEQVISKKMSHIFSYFTNSALQYMTRKPRESINKSIKTNNSYNKWLIINVQQVAQLANLFLHKYIILVINSYQNIYIIVGMKSLLILVLYKLFFQFGLEMIQRSLTNFSFCSFRK